MAKVKAVYNYSYDYEGTQITFKIGEEFQLLSKANTDWWHVRRWKDGAAQDIYVPAVYVKEVKEEKTNDTNPLYENVAELAKKIQALQKIENGSAVTANGPVYDLPAPKAPKPKPLAKSSPSHKPATDKLSTSPPHRRLERNSSSETDAKPNGFFAAKEQKLGTEEYAEPILPSRVPTRTTSGKKENSPGPPGGDLSSLKPGIREGWLPGYALPTTKPRSRSINASAAGDRTISPELPQERAASPNSGGSGKAKIPPPVLPKSKPARPRSMIVTSPTLHEKQEPGLSSTLPSNCQPKKHDYESMAVEERQSDHMKLPPLELRKTPSPNTAFAEAVKQKVK